ncbi:MAG: hypothetical protein IPM71_12980 [Bacteroidota bacterium]|nr:MAG: hypothetical protein IPM71_12980 [Bacteroidota bacterium]
MKKYVLLIILCASFSYNQAQNIRSVTLKDENLGGIKKILPIENTKDNIIVFEKITSKTSIKQGRFEGMEKESIIQTLMLPNGNKISLKQNEKLLSYSNSKIITEGYDFETFEKKVTFYKLNGSNLIEEANFKINLSDYNIPVHENEKIISFENSDGTLYSISIYDKDYKRKVIVDFGEQGMTNYAFNYNNQTLCYATQSNGSKTITITSYSIISETKKYVKEYYVDDYVLSSIKYDNEYILVYLSSQINGTSRLICYKQGTLLWEKDLPNRTIDNVVLINSKYNQVVANTFNALLVIDLLTGKYIEQINNLELVPNNLKESWQKYKVVPNISLINDNERFSITYEVSEDSEKESHIGSLRIYNSTDIKGNPIYSNDNCGTNSKSVIVKGNLFLINDLTISTYE